MTVRTLTAWLIMGLTILLLHCNAPLHPADPEARRLDSLNEAAHALLQQQRPIAPEWMGRFIEKGEAYCGKQHDSLRCPRFYYLAAHMVMTQTGQSDVGIKYLHRIVKEYPHSPIAPQALWEKALIYEMTQNKEGARAAYKALMVRYPDDSLADLARKAIQLIDSLPIIPAVSP